MYRLRRLATWLLAVLFAALLMGGAFRHPLQAGTTAALPEVGHHAPPFQAADLQGRPADLAQLRGAVVVLNFWATWCGPCRLEMPELQRLHNRNDAAGVYIVAVNRSETETSPQAVANFVRSHGYSFAVWLDPDGSAARKYQVFAVPTTYFVGPDGVIRAKHAGPMDMDAMLAGIEAAQAGVGTGAAAARPLLPTGFQVGSLPIATSNLVLILGLVAAYLLAVRGGLHPDVAGETLVNAALGAVLGPRVLVALREPALTAHNPARLLLATGGPLAWVGAALGAAVAVWLAWRRRRDWVAVLDALALPLLVGGAVAALGWPDPRGPALAALCAGAALLLAAGRRGAPVGAIVLSTVLGAAVAGFVADFFLPAAARWGITPLQWRLCLLALLAYIGMGFLPHPLAADGSVAR